MAEQLERLPPHDLVAEAAVLGCCMMSPEHAIPELMARLGGNKLFFYDLRHQDIFSAMRRLHDQGVPVDAVTLTTSLSDAGKLADVGGYAYVSSLPEATPTSAALDHYTDIVVSKYALRRVLGVCADTVETVLQKPDNVTGLLEGLESRLQGVMEGWLRVGENRSPKELKQAIDFEHDYHDRWLGIKPELKGLHLPFALADFGIRPSEFTIVAGDSESGKSTWMGEVAVCLAAQGAKVAMASMEMPVPRLLHMMARQILGRDKLPEGSEGERLMWAAFEMLQRNFYFYHVLGITHWRHMLDAFTYARDHCGANVAIIDNLGMIGIGEDDYSEQNAASSAMATWAHSSAAHLFAVHHINKAEGVFKNRVRGSKRWTDYADNAVEWSRNDSKREKLGELIEKHRCKEVSDEEFEEQKEKMSGLWDAKCVLRKNRYDEDGRANASRYLWFNWRAKQFHDNKDAMAVTYLPMST